MPITRERAERIARAHACVGCQEYTYRKIAIREATAALRQEFGEIWHAVLVLSLIHI